MNPQANYITQYYMTRGLFRIYCWVYEPVTHLKKNYWVGEGGVFWIVAVEKSQPT